MFGLLLAVIYLAFISLGLPDSLLGAAWPSMYEGLGVPLSYAGIAAMIISAGTVVSSLLSYRLTHRFGTGRVTAASVLMTAAALLGFSFSNSFLTLCLWAVPYGLGAGSVDASLNNFVALHFKSRHMSWLHCMWGVGAAAGPYFMGIILTGGYGWNSGYRLIGCFQLIFTAVLFLSLPLWNIFGSEKESENDKKERALSLLEVLRLKGVFWVMVCFFCYCALEQTAGLWAGSYLTIAKGFSAERAAGLAGLFFLGITAGRAISGFLTFKLDDSAMIRLGEVIIFLGIFFMLLPLGALSAVLGLVLTGLGCAPVYPCIIHQTPVHFGAENSQAVIGVQMASAYAGILTMPPVFGLIAQHISAALLPGFLAVLLIVLAAVYELLLKKTAKI